MVRALADMRGHRCDLISRGGYIFPKFTLLSEELAHAMRVKSAVFDGEIVCLGADGRSRFYDLLFRREWPYYVVFDALMIDGEDMSRWPLVERKRRLRSVMPRVESHSRILISIMYARMA